MIYSKNEDVLGRMTHAAVLLIELIGILNRAEVPYSHISSEISLQVNALKDLDDMRITNKIFKR